VIIVLLGPPGAGKGTQGERLAARLNFPKIATGDVFRAAVREGTPLGLKAKEYMDRGDLVPDEVILGIMRDVLASKDAERGAILDGVVRTVPQAQGFSNMLAELGRNIDAVLLFEVEDEELVRRLSGRTTCDVCQTPYTGLEVGTPCPKNDGGTLVRRKDDEPEAIRNRLKVYHNQTAPVVAWYEEHDMPVHRIDAVGTVDEVTTRALAALEAVERA
jgi:adenylate kinase